MPDAGVASGAVATAYWEQQESRQLAIYLAAEC